MSIYIVDVEADGPAPGKYSMVSFGAVRVDRELQTTFYGQTRPLTEHFIPEALAVSGHTREAHLAFEDPVAVMARFVAWVKATSTGRPVFMSDNPAFDWQWINYYCHNLVGENPFGHSARRIGDFYAGLKQDFFAASKWRHLRKTAHTHHPVDDAKGNAEALLAMGRQFNVRIPG